MTVIVRNIDPFWHEKYMMILILNKEPLQRKELYKRLREEQKKRIVIGEKNVTHSNSAYKYWVNRRKEQWVINEKENTLELTQLGKWIVNSTLGTFDNRDDFIDLLCPNCIKTQELTLLKPILDTAETNAKDRLFMDIECLRCDYNIKRMPISEVFSVEEFISFYNNALSQLQQIVKITGQLLEDK